MAQIRRYGPSSVMPEVTPAPQLGNASAQVFETLEKGFSSVNEFIRPAVVEVKTKQGEQEFLDQQDGVGPQYRIRETNAVGDVAPTDIDGRRVGPTRERAGEPPAGSPRPGPTKENAKGRGWDWKRAALAIRSVESMGSGDYRAMGPVTDNGDRAYGAYQVMGANIASWTKKHWGRALTPEEFLDSPPAQDAVFRGEFGSSVAKYGNEQDAASVWFTGRPLAEGGNASDGYLTGNQYVDKFTRALGGFDNQGNPQNYELEVINGQTFEPRLPFTVRDAAFNAAADRVLEARASAALEMGMTIAMQKADGNLEVLQREMEKVRSEIIGSLPQNLPGLKVDLEAAFTRSASVAQRQAMDLAQRRMIARQGEAQAQAESALQAEVERIALTGGSSTDIASALAQGQEALVKFGPREGFVLNGREYPPDPARAGTMTVSDIAAKVSGIGSDAQRVMIEAEFQKSAAPGQFVDEFRRQVYAGKSPLPAGESLELLASLEARARSAESARRTAANEERERLKKEVETAINPYVEMTEQGVPVAIPAAERTAILTKLAPYPDLQREAMTEFAVADAAVATHGMRGPELLAYTERVRQDVADAAARGELDLEGVAVLQSLEDRVKKITDAVTAEMIGLPLVEQLAVDGAAPDQINWDELRTRANGKPEILEQIAATEAFYNAIGSMDGMTARERDAVLAEARMRQRELAAQGKDYGAAALLQTQVIDKLETWNARQKELAANDAMKFAASKGIPMPSMAEAKSLQDVGSVISERVRRIAPLSVAEGVENPVPITADEAELIAQTFNDPATTRQQQAAFLASVVGLGKDRATAIFAKIGRSEPGLFAAGMVYAMGNQDAATTILRGAGDQKVTVDTGAEASARTAALGGLSAYLSDADVVQLDSIAMAYARGLAIKEGQRSVTSADLEEGYRIATGGQADGTGGVSSTVYGETILPPGYDADRFQQTIEMIDDGALVRLAPGGVYDEAGEFIWSRDFLNTIEGMQPTRDPHVFLPVAADGARFVTINNGIPGFVTIDIRQVEAARKASELDKRRQQEGEARAAEADTASQEAAKQASDRQRLEKELQLQTRLLERWESNGQPADLLTRQRAKIADLMAQIEAMQ